MSGLIFLTALTAASVFYVRRIGLNLSLTSVALGLLLVIHGPFYLIYSRCWVFNDSWIHRWYSDTLGYSSLVAIHYEKLTTDPYSIPALHNLDVALALLFVGCMAGISAVDIVTKTRKVEYGTCIDSWKKQSVVSASSSFYRIQFIVVAIICVILLASYIYYDKPSAVFHYFFSKASEDEKIRWRISSGGFPYLLALFLSSIATFLSIYLISQPMARRTATYAVSIVFIILILFGRMAYLSKAPVLIFILQLALALVVYRTLKPKWMMIAGLGVLGTASMVTMVFVANSEIARLQGALAFLFYRAFMIPNESLLEYFLVFPYRLPHTLGIDNKFIAAIIGLEKIQDSYFRVSESIRGAGGSTTNGLFIADAWAEFNWWGVATFPVLFGAILRYIDVAIITRIGKTPTSIAAIVTGYYGVFIALNTSLFTACLTGGLALILTLVWAYSRIRRPQICSAVEPFGKDNANLPE